MIQICWDTSYFLRLFSIVLCILPLLSACASSVQGEEPTPIESNNVDRASAIVWNDCHLSTLGAPIRIPARCFLFKTFENPIQKSGHQIALKVAVIPAVSHTPAPDPLVFLAGGPGQAATEAYPLLHSFFEEVHRQRDIVLIDQRGTGAESPLRCPQAALNSELDEDDPASLTKQLQNCLKEIDADPTQYTTSLAMADLEAIRTLLGYDKLNLLGVSYGTRAALTYLHQYPAHVRTVTLDGVVPQDEILGSEVATDAQRALDLIFARCAAEEACQQSFPNLSAELKNLLQGAETKPVDLTIAHPLTGKPTDLTLDQATVALTIRLLSYAPESAALLPLLIDQAAQANYTALAAQSLAVSEELSGSINSAMNFSVLCAEDAPFFAQADVAAQTKNSYYGSLEIDHLQQICQVWPRGSIPSDFKEPVQSNIPVLLLSGEADPVTPPTNGERVARHLSNSLHVVAPGQGHNIIFRGCIPRIFRNFVESASLADLQTDCVKDLKAMPFFINAVGTAP